MGCSCPTTSDPLVQLALGRFRFVSVTFIVAVTGSDGRRHNCHTATVQPTGATRPSSTTKSSAEHGMEPTGEEKHSSRDNEARAPRQDENKLEDLP